MGEKRNTQGLSTLGIPVIVRADEEAVPSRFQWGELSEETLEAIRVIEENAALASFRMRHFLIGAVR